MEGKEGILLEISENFLSNLGLANLGEVFSSCEAVGGRVLLIFLGGGGFHVIESVRVQFVICTSTTTSLKMIVLFRSTAINLV